jgi:hypothetical protein
VSRTHVESGENQDIEGGIEMKRVIGSIVVALGVGVLVSGMLTPARWGLEWASPISLALWLLGPFLYVLAWLALFNLIAAPMDRLVGERREE